MAGGMRIIGRPVHKESLMENCIFLFTVSVVTTVKESVQQYIKLMLCFNGVE
jgi:hypothetical protein